MPQSFDKDDMHREVEWLTRSDVSILEFLHSARDVRGNPSIQSPKTIAENTGISRKHCGNRCRELVDRGLVERVGHGLYRLSDRGEQLMTGEIRPADL